jgi:hypothetical protein
VVAGRRKREFHIKIFVPIRPDIALGKNFPVYKPTFREKLLLATSIKREHHQTLSRKSLRRRFDSIFTHSSVAEKWLLN